MRRPFIQYSDELRQALARGTVITDTTVQAREIRLACNLEHQKNSFTLWRSPRVSTFDRWVQASYTELTRIGWEQSNRELIDDDVLHHLMEHAAPEDEYVRHTATAVDAWKIFNSWFLHRVPREDLLQTENSRIWMDWLSNFKELLTEHKLITRTELAPLLAEAASAEIWLPQVPLAFFGRGERTRAQDELIHLLAARGAQVETIAPSSTFTAESQRVAFESPQAEWTSIAWWTREQLELHGHDHRIGIVCANLKGNQSRFKHRFEAVFPEIDDIDQVVEINSGIPLLECQLCNDLLGFFYWLGCPISPSDFKKLSLSRYLKNLELPSSPYALSVEFDSYVRRRGSNRLRRIAELLDGAEERSLMDWISVISQILQVLEWRQTTEEEGGQATQARIGFGNLLNTVAHFSGFEGVCTWNRTIEILQQRARASSLPPPFSQANVQVLRQADSIGLEFDSLWVANMSDVEWPPAADPNPMIPIRVLREAVVSKTTPKQMLTWAEGLIEAWLSNCSNLVFSHASELEEENHEASHLLQEIESDDLNSVLRDTTLAKHEHVWSPAKQLDVVRQFPADVGNPLPESQYGRQRTAMLKNQAQCPFRGWAVNRLKLDPPEEFGPFLEAVHRGSIIHLVLENIIADAKTQAKLASTSEQTIRKVVSDTVDEYIENEQFELGKKYIENEKELIFERILLWRASELERDPWSVVEIEGERSISVDKFDFSIRVDRIDKIGKTKKVVIDYKTGNVSPRDWDPERPIEPQMPLYAIAVEKSHGVIYEQIASDRTSYKGCSSTDLNIKGVETAESRYGVSFNTLKKNWETSLEEIVTEFKDGRAVVDPQNNGEVCNYCHLGDFCRVFDDIQQYSPILREAVDQ